MKTSAVGTGDIPVNNSKIRDFILSSCANRLAGTKKVIWYFETLVLSARYIQLLKLSKWGRDSKRYKNRFALWQNELNPRIAPGAIAYEFGVATGAATKWWSNQNVPFGEWHGFDTFSGLPTARERGGIDVMKAGVFDQTGNKSKLPVIDANYDIHFHEGLISETLVKTGFQIMNDRQKIVFVDVDLYEPTKEILFYFAENLKTGDLIYFDEAFDPWNEGLAIREMLQSLPPFKALAHTGSALLIQF